MSEKLGFCAPVGQRRQLGLEPMNEKEKVMRGKEVLCAVIGGYVVVGSRGNHTLRATITVNEYGNGVIKTRDKNGNRLADLK